MNAFKDIFDVSKLKTPYEIPYETAAIFIVR